jgi:Ca2+-binding EF-hand superfamily protein
MGAAAPSIANSMQRDRTMFQQLDRDRNGTLTYHEFRAD